MGAKSTIIIIRQWKRKVNQPAKQHVVEELAKKVETVKLEEHPPHPAEEEEKKGKVEAVDEEGKQFEGPEVPT